MQLYLIRHAQSIHNAQNKLQGHYDSPLSPNGIQQAHQLGQYFQKHKTSFDHIYSSDLSRAAKTAEIVTSYQSNLTIIKKTKNIRERKLGIWENKPKPNIINKTNFKKISKIFPHRIVGIESNQAFYQRCQDFIHQLLNKHHNKQKIAVFTHAGTINMIRGVLYHQKYHDIIIKKYNNTAISQFKITKTKQLQNNNDHHLAS